MIEGKWSDLRAAVEACKSTLSRYHDLMSVFSEMNDCLANMGQIEVSSNSRLYSAEAVKESTI